MKLLVMLIVIMSLGCALDQEESQIKNDPPVYPIKKKVVVEYVYIDADGNEITDPEIIEEIKTSNNL